MKQVVIENPVINSPFDEPQRHFRFTDEGIANEIVPERRVSSYFIHIAKPKQKGKQLYFDTEWTQRGEQVHQPGAFPGGYVASRWLPGHHQDHRPPS